LYDIKAIKDLCSWLPALRVLDLSFNKLHELPDELRLLRNLVKLIVSGNYITTEALNRFCAKPSGIQELNLRYNRIAVVPEHIENLYNLRVLHVRGNSLISPDIQELKRLLPHARIII
jgi:Leucine-rich repeat (LRR) protein